MIANIEGTRHAITDWVLTEPEQGDWSAALTIQRDAHGESGDITLFGVCTFAGWRGVVTRAHRNGGFWIVHVQGCPMISDATAPRQYTRPTDRARILGDLCASVGARASDEPLGLVGQWRARGGALVEELIRLSSDGAWYVDALGAVHASSRADDAVDPPGEYLGASGWGRAYACDIPTPLAGTSVAGALAGTAVFQGGPSARPSVILTDPAPPARKRLAPIVIGTASDLADGRCDVLLDSGATLRGVPLFCAAGFAPDGADRVRVLVLDVGDSGANTIAITGVDGKIDALTLARAADAGPLLRAGDRVSITGLVAGMTPVSGPPGAVSINYDPTVQGYGPPGSGRSRVKG